MTLTLKLVQESNGGGYIYTAVSIGKDQLASITKEGLFNIYQKMLESNQEHERRKGR